MRASIPRLFLSVLCPAVLALGLASCKTTKEPAEPPPAETDFDRLLESFARSLHLIADLNENGDVTYQELLRVNRDADPYKFQEADTDDSGGLSLAESVVAVRGAEISDVLWKKFDVRSDGSIRSSDQARFDEMIAATEGMRRFVEVEDIFEL